MHLIIKLQFCLTINESFSWNSNKEKFKNSNKSMDYAKICSYSTDNNRRRHKRHDSVTLKRDSMNQTINGRQLQKHKGNFKQIATREINIRCLVNCLEALTVYYRIDYFVTCS